MLSLLKHLPPSLVGVSPSSQIASNSEVKKVLALEDYGCLMKIDEDPLEDYVLVY